MSWNIIGHDWAALLLAEHIARGEERHAYLFTGPPAVGRRTLALRFAQALNCLQPPEPGQPCGTCRVCVQTERMQHPDLFVVQAEQAGKTLKVEQIRELQHSLSLAPIEARYKIGLLLRFQEAKASAANALLKTLEEAPSRVILLLTADTSESLLPTIVSRCEVLRLRPMAVSDLGAALQRTEALPGDQARRLAHLTSGRYGAARQFITDSASMEERRVLLEDGLRLLNEPLRERFAYADKLAKDRERMRLALMSWQTLWRDVLLCASGADGAEVPLVNIDYEDKFNEIAASMNISDARKQIVGIEEALRREEGNANARMVLETLLMDWPRK